MCHSLVLRYKCGRKLWRTRFCTAHTATRRVPGYNFWYRRRRVCQQIVRVRLALMTYCLCGECPKVTGTARYRHYSNTFSVYST